MEVILFDKYKTQGKVTELIRMGWNTEGSEKVPGLCAYTKCRKVYKRKKRRPEPSKEELSFLIANTNYTEHVVKKCFLQFLREFPKRMIARDDIFQMFIAVLPMDTVANVVDLIFTEFDLDKDDKIDFKEFILAKHAVRTSSPEQQLRWIFQMLDQDRSGTVELREVVLLFTTFYMNEGLDTEDGIERSIAVYDTLDDDKNGEITQEEFIGNCLAKKDLLHLLQRNY